MGIMWKDKLYQGRTIDYTCIYYLNKFTQREDLLPYLLNRPRMWGNCQKQHSLAHFLPEDREHFLVPLVPSVGFAEHLLDSSPSKWFCCRVYVESSWEQGKEYTAYSCFECI
jgi:hypothetical protein